MTFRYPTQFGQEQPSHARPERSRRSPTFPSLTPRRRLAILCCLLMVLVLGGQVLPVEARPATAPGAPAAAPPEGRPGIYVFFDWNNIDPAVYPVTGGHITFEWKQIETGPGQYDWSQLDAWLDLMASSNKPAIIGFATYNALCCGGDSAPAYLYDVYPDMRLVCEDVWVIPKYWSQSYLNEFSRFLRAAGERYDGDPRIVFVEIGIGIYGETKPADTIHRDCLVGGGLTRNLWVQTSQRLMDEHLAAFPTTPLMLQYAPYFESPHERRALSDYAAERGIGLKHNGLRPDADATNYDDPNYSLYATGQYDPMFKWWQQVPIGWESYEAQYMTGLINTTWGVYSGLDKHADYFVFARDLVTQADRAPILRFALQHLGKTIANSPSAWVALRETEYTWYPQFGNYDFFMVQNDAVPGGRTVPLWNVSQYPEGRYTRRTDSGSGNPYMYFDIEDGYLFNTRERVRLNVTYYDHGNDSFDVRYDAWDNPNKLAGTVRKTNTGRWLKASWVLTDARFGNRQPGGGQYPGSDLSIYARGDGDEIIHLMQVERLDLPAPPPASPTPTPVATPTPAWTPEPPGYRQSIVYRQGLNGYSGASDTFITSWEPDTNYGAAATLLVRSARAHSGLIRFDGIGLPSGATLDKARLRLYIANRSNSISAYVRAFEMFTPWEANRATWRLARAGVPWSQPGIGPAEYASMYSDFKYIFNTGHWIELDVTRTVQRWLQSPNTNRGLLLEGYARANVQYEFASSDHPQASLRPQLVLEYLDPSIERTPTPTPNPAWTPTPTRTPTRTPTATAVGGPTATPTRTPTRTPTATVVSGPTATPTRTVTPDPLLLVLQPGLNGYGGLADTYISQWAPDENFASSPFLNARSGHVMSSLLRFELQGAIPAGYHVVEAQLQLFATAKSNTNPMTLELYELGQRFVTGEANWNRARVGGPWHVPGALGAPGDRGLAALGALPVLEQSWHSFDVTAQVQRWLGQPASNLGLLVAGQAAGAVGVSLISAEGQPAERRPLLRLRLAAGPTPTPTPTPAPVTVELLPAADTYYSQWTPTDTFGASITLGVRSANVAEAFIRFPLEGIPPGSQVLEASLALTALSNSNAQVLRLEVQRLNRTWSEPGLNWLQAAAGAPWAQPGAAAVPQDRADRVYAQRTLNTTGAFALDVSALVQEWIGQGVANHGLVLRGESSGRVQYNLASREHPDAAARPRLILTYRPAAAGPAPTATPTATTIITPNTATPTPTHTSTSTSTSTSTPTPTHTPAPTLPPGGQVVELNLVSSADTSIDAWYPGSNYGRDALARVRNNNIVQPLFAFDASSVPANAVLDSAILRLWVDGRSNSNSFTAAVYSLKRPWAEYEATHQQAAAGVAWQLAGAAGSQDRALPPLATAALPASGPVEWDVTAAVQQWVRQPGSNFGFILDGVAGGHVHYSFGAREHSFSERRPLLVLRYRLPPTPTHTPTRTPTPTATRTPTAAPTQAATVTPTGAPGGRHIGAAFGSATLDGHLDEWTGAGLLLDTSTAARVSNPAAITGPADSSMTVWARWDHEFLYLAFDVRDDVLVADSGDQLWHDDSIEVGVDGEKDRQPNSPTGGDHQYQIRFDGAAADRTLAVDPSVRWATRVTAGGYQVELAIPVSQLGGGAWIAGRQIGIDFGLNDDDDGGDRDSYLVWSSFSTYSDSANFGVLTLLPEALPTPTATNTPTVAPTHTSSPAPTATATPTAAPEAAQERTFAPIADTFISAWYANDNFGVQSNLRVRSFQVESSLLRFDLSELPPGARVQSASFEAYVVGRSNVHPLTARFFQLQRPWQERQATYYLADTGQPWSEPLAAGGQDRAPAAFATLSLPAEGWIAVDFAAVVQTWVNVPASNAGFSIEGDATGAVHYSLASREWWQAALRPRLVVRYLPPLPTATPTHTPTRTPSATPSPTATSTATATATPTITPTPTFTPIPTSTATASPTFTPSPTPSRTATPTPSPTPSATPTPTPENWRVVAAGADTYLYSWFPSMNFGSESTLVLRTEAPGPGLAFALLRFDLTSLPDGAAVNSAILRLRVLDTNLPAEVRLAAHQVLRPWLAHEATWTKPQASAAWEQPGALGAADRAGTPIAISAPLAAAGFVSLDVTALVQGWLAAPGADHGLLLAGQSAVELPVNLASFDHSLAEWRPRLELTLE